MEPAENGVVGSGVVGAGVFVHGGVGADIGGGEVCSPLRQNGAESGASLPAHHAAADAYGAAHVVIGRAPVQGPAERAVHALVLPAAASKRTGNNEDIIAPISSRLMLSEALLRASGTGASYSTYWEDGGFVSTVQSRIPRKCHPSCSGTLSFKSRVVGSATQAEEEVAVGLIRVLRLWRRVVVADANWGRVNRMRRTAIRLSVTAQAALREKQQAAENARLLEEGWAITIDDLISLRGACDMLCSLASTNLVSPSSADDRAEVLQAARALSLRMLD